MKTREDKIYSFFGHLIVENLVNLAVVDVSKNHQAKRGKENKPNHFLMDWLQTIK